jgi:hypothetical protein
MEKNPCGPHAQAEELSVSEHESLFLFETEFGEEDYY